MGQHSLFCSELIDGVFCSIYAGLTAVSLFSGILVKTESKCT